MKQIGPLNVHGTLWISKYNHWLIPDSASLFSFSDQFVSTKVSVYCACIYAYRIQNTAKFCSRDTFTLYSSVFLFSKRSMTDRNNSNIHTFCTMHAFVVFSIYGNCLPKTFLKINKTSYIYYGNRFIKTKAVNYKHFLFIIHTIEFTQKEYTRIQNLSTIFKMRQNWLYLDTLVQNQLSRTVKLLIIRAYTLRKKFGHSSIQRTDKANV